MKDNHEKIREQYEEKLTNLENERKTLEEKLEDNQSLERVLRTEYNDVRNRNKELIDENDILQEKFSNIEFQLKTKVAELSEIKGQLDFLWNQTHHLTDLSPLPNIVPTRDFSAMKVLSNSPKTLGNSPTPTTLLALVESSADSPKTLGDSPAPTTLLASVESSADSPKTLGNSPTPTTLLAMVESSADSGACTCWNNSTMQKSASTNGFISVDVAANSMTNLNNINSCNRLTNLHNGIDGDNGACACGSNLRMQKKSTSTTGLISVDVGANSMTNLNNINSCNSLKNLHKEIARAVSPLPYEVSNDKCAANRPTSLRTENTETKNLERIRTLLIAELTSLQLLHSMFDLTVSSLTKTECSKESMCVPLQSKTNLEEYTEKEDDRHSSSTPSGYETGSLRGSQVDIIHCNDDDAINSEYLQDSDEEKLINETFQLSPVISEQITESVPSTMSSPDLDLHSVHLDKISLLHKEIDNQRKTIDAELVKMLYDMIGSRMLDWDNKIRKRDIYCHLVRVLTDSDSKSQFDIDQLEQILNLVLVDHSITGCLLTLSHREKTKDVEKLLTRLSTFESDPKSIFDHSDEQKYFNYDNDTTEVDSLIPYVSPSSITAALTTMQMVSDNEIERVEIEVDKPSNGSEFPVRQRKGLLSRFLCMSVSSIRRPKKRKSNKYVLAKEN